MKTKIKKKLAKASIVFELLTLKLSYFPILIKICQKNIFYVFESPIRLKVLLGRWWGPIRVTHFSLMSHFYTL